MPHVKKVADYTASMPNKQRYVLGLAAVRDGLARPAAGRPTSAPRCITPRSCSWSPRHGGQAAARRRRRTRGTFKLRRRRRRAARRVVRRRTTLAARMQVAKERGLGFGVWRLGQEDQRIWDDPADRARQLAVASSRAVRSRQFRPQPALALGTWRRFRRRTAAANCARRHVRVPKLHIRMNFAPRTSEPVARSPLTRHDGHGNRLGHTAHPCSRSAFRRTHRSRRLASVAVLGLGYVGLPTGIGLANRGAKVTGVDVSERRLQDIREGSVDLAAGERERLQSALELNELMLTSSPGALRGSGRGDDLRSDSGRRSPRARPAAAARGLRDGRSRTHAATR